MKITITNTLDKNSLEKNKESKIALFNNLLEQFALLFYEDLRKKQEQFSNNKTDIKKLKNEISGNRDLLLKSKTNFAIESLKKRILNEINILDKVEDEVKSAVTEIILKLDDQSIVELEKRLTLLQRMNRKQNKGIKNEEAPKRSV